MESQMKKLITLLAVIILWASPVWAQGPIVLMGLDAEDGGPEVHGPISVYVDVVNHILSQATYLGNTGSGILVIGGGKDASDDVTPVQGLVQHRTLLKIPCLERKIEHGARMLGSHMVV